MVTLIYVIGPERRIDKMHILNGDVLGIRDICQSRTLGILVGTLGIPLPTNPELLPVVEAIAVDGSLTADGKPIESIGIHQCREIFACLSFYACQQNREINDPL